MKKPKYKTFSVTMNDGKTYEIKSPVSKVSEEYFKLLASHNINLKYKTDYSVFDTVTCVGIN